MPNSLDGKCPPTGLGCFCLVICIGVLPACIYMHHKYALSMEAREGIKSTGIGVYGGL